jgi:DNA-damage-inducible protein J
MAQKSFNIRLDADEKRGFDEFCRSVGLNATTAINLYVKTVLREQRIPFEISARVVTDPFYSDANQKYLLESIAQLEAKKGRQPKSAADYGDHKQPVSRKPIVRRDPDPFYSDTNQKYLLESIAQLEGTPL